MSQCSLQTLKITKSFWTSHEWINVTCCWIWRMTIWSFFKQFRQLKSNRRIIQQPLSRRLSIWTCLNFRKKYESCLDVDRIRMNSLFLFTVWMQNLSICLSNNKKFKSLRCSWKISISSFNSMWKVKWNRSI